jgi:hypothetical protein
MSKQNQLLENSAVGFQAQRDIIVKNGISADELTSILDSHVNYIVAIATQTARQKAQERVEELTPKIIERITSQPDSSPEALKDPDFHFALFKAQQAYARSGEPDVGEILVDLIGHRVTQGVRTRLALSLNDAIEKVAALTANEFATLSIIYVLRYSRRLDINNYERFIDWLRVSVLPYVADLPDHELSLSHLEAQSCGKISLASMEFRNMFIIHYAGVLSKGFDKDEIKKHAPEQYGDALDNPKLIRRCLHDAGKWQLNALNKEVFSKEAGACGLPQDVIERIWSFFEGTLWSDEEFVSNISQRLPEFSSLSKLWRDTKLAHFEINTVGIAIAHANARRVTTLDADLGIWIK